MSIVICEDIILQLLGSTALVLFFSAPSFTVLAFSVFRTAHIQTRIHTIASAMCVQSQRIRLL